MRILAAKQVPTYICRWVLVILSHGKANILVRDALHTYRIGQETPEDSPLSLALFLHFIDDMLRLPILRSVVVYADDIALCQTEDPSTVLQFIQPRLDAIAAWCSNSHMCFTLHKYQYMLVQPSSRRYVASPQSACSPLLLNECPFRHVDSLSILGVKFTPPYLLPPKLVPWWESARHCSRRSTNFVATFGPFNPKILHKFITGTLYPTLSYGCIAWSVGLKQAELTAVNQVIRKAEIMITGCLHSTSYEAPYVLTGFPNAQNFYTFGSTGWMSDCSPRNKSDLDEDHLNYNHTFRC